MTIPGIASEGSRLSSLGRQALTSLSREIANPMTPTASTTITAIAPISSHGTWRRVAAAGRLPRVTGFGPRFAPGR